MPIKNIDEVIRVIHNCAVSYKNNLLNKNALFVTAGESKADCFETLFRPENFLHLTGVKTNLDASLFLQTAINSKLSDCDKLRHDITYPTLIGNRLVEICVLADLAWYY